MYIVAIGNKGNPVQTLTSPRPPGSPMQPPPSADPCLPLPVSFSVQHYSLTAAPYSLQDELNSMLTGTQSDSAGRELSHPGPIALSDTRSARHPVSCLSCPTAVHTDPLSPFLIHFLPAPDPALEPVSACANTQGLPAVLVATVALLLKILCTGRTVFKSHPPSPPCLFHTRAHIQMHMCT